MGFLQEGVISPRKSVKNPQKTPFFVINRAELFFWQKRAFLGL
jgi:hypothetical protein